MHKISYSTLEIQNATWSYFIEQTVNKRNSEWLYLIFSQTCVNFILALTERTPLAVDVFFIIVEFSSCFP